MKENYIIEKKITYSDLSIPLKISVVLAWLVGILYAGAFFAGFLVGLAGEI